jgi:hypothetical protein
LDNAHKAPETFGEKSLAAVSSGWSVITSIFLFILPLWPLFLIAGIGYYFYKKRVKTQPIMMLINFESPSFVMDFLF